jgi:hypothetical protein
LLTIDVGGAKDLGIGAKVFIEGLVYFLAPKGQKAAESTLKTFPVIKRGNRKSLINGGLQLGKSSMKGNSRL